MAISPEQLKHVPLFSELDDRELKSIASSLRERSFDAGTTVTEEGTSGIGFFVIEDGTATVSVGGSEVRKLGAGDYFGEIALMAKGPRSATILADTDLHCYGLTAWDFRALVDANESMSWKLLETLAERLAASQPAG
jgi:CRP/FNR family transcriptional regulator, cyclic AMP receptor protein